MRTITFKAIACFISFVVLAANVSKAQDYYESTYEYKRVSLGIGVSPSLSWMRYGDNNEFSGKSKGGFAYGLLADFGIAENYYFSTGFMINTLNAQATQTGEPVRDYRIQYAEVPISVKLKSTQRYFRSYFGQFGFTTGFKLNAKESIAGSKRTAMKGDADVLRLGLVIGGGVDWQLDHNLKLMTGLSFNNGFTRAVKLGEPKNSYLALNLGLFF